MDDDTLDSFDASEFWLQDTALQADSMPVESMDFGLLLGDVVSRDGLQRPLLTSGSPVRTPVPRRANKQPINVTHVHQTVVQHFGPVHAALLHAQQLWPKAHQASLAWRAHWLFRKVPYTSLHRGGSTGAKPRLRQALHCKCMMVPFPLAPACQPHCTHP